MKKPLHTEFLSIFERSPFDSDKKTFSAVLLTETPIRRVDFDGNEFWLLFLIDGVKLPKSKRLGLWDSHQTYSVRNNLGSVLDLRVENNQVLGEVRPSSAEPAIAQKVADEDLESLSFGIHIWKQEFVPAGKTKTIKGRQITGPTLVALVSQPWELSLVCEPGDPNAKIIQKLSAQQLNSFVDADSETTYGGQLSQEVTKQEELTADAAEVKEETKVELAAAKIDTNAIEQKAKAESKKETRQLLTAIRKAATSVGLSSDFADSLCEQCDSIEDANKAILAQLGNQQTKLNVVVTSNGQDRQVEAQLAAMTAKMMSCVPLSNPEKHKTPEKVDERFKNFRLVDHARACLEADNQDCRYWDNDKIVKTALLSGGYNTPGSLSNLLTDASHAMLQAGYADADTTYQLWVNQLPSTPDLKDVNLIEMSGLGYIDAWDGKSKPEEKAVTDAKSKVKMNQYDNIVSFPWTTLVNDTLGGVATVPFKAGKMCNRSVNADCYAPLVNNILAEDGTAFFDSSHNNNLTGASAPSVANVSLMSQKLRAQTNRDNSLLGLKPKFLMGNGSNEQKIGEICFSQYNPTANQFMVHNAYNGLVPVIDDELGSSSTAYYLLPDKSNSPVNLVFKQGLESPQVDIYYDPDTRALKINILQAWGVLAYNYRLAVRHTGS